MELTKLKEISDWLQNEAEERMKQVMGREEMARSMRGATAKELREAKITAEKMSGHKLHGVSATVEDAQRSAGIDERIAAKLDTEARQLSAWADYLLSGSGAAVSASPLTLIPEQCQRWFSLRINGKHIWRFTKDELESGLGKRVGEINDEFSTEAPAASPGPRPYKDGDAQNWFDDYCYDNHINFAKRIEIGGEEAKRLDELVPEILEAFMAQFFPASLNGEKRAPDKFSQKWSQDAFVILAGLKESVSWELAPEIMKEINRLVEELLATTQGTPEGTE